MVSRFEARRTEYNAVVNPDIPAYEPMGTNNIVYRVVSGADAGLYNGNGLQASDSSVFEAATGDFTIADCLAAGYQVGSVPV